MEAKKATRFLVPSVFMFCVVLIGSFCVAQEDLAELVDQVEPAVVKILVDDGRGGGSLGSGFVVAPGYVITNRHVVEDGVRGEVVFRDERKYPIQGILYDGGDMDICILKIDGLTASGKRLRIRESLPRKGETVYAFGTPKGYEFTVSDGIISALRKIDTNLKVTDSPDGQQYLQTTAPISSGNSGGPLVDKNGLVVGMNTWVRTDGQNLNFSLACTEITKSLKKVGSVVKPMTSVRSKDPVAKAVKYLDVSAVIMRRWQIDAEDQRNAIKGIIKEWELRLENTKNEGERAAIRVYLEKLRHRHLCVFTERSFQSPKLFLADVSGVRRNQYGLIQESLRILQVIDGTNCLVVVGGELYRMAGYPTANLVDEQKFTAAKGPTFVVSGTWDYRTQGGGTKRVFIISPALELEETTKNLISDLKQQAKHSEIAMENKIAKITTRKWTSGNFATIASFIRVSGIGDDFQARLLRDDNGEEIKVNLDRLSESDRAWINGYQKHRNLKVP
jgi:hypothetical protein